ncbi:MAG: hypothetical protein LIP77_05360, partial [Planctomycetes bacterium]|nr:hypothetical protein [Planctomycetota bacterium]
LKCELEEIRATRIAWEREEHVQNLNGAAAAICDADDQPIAALCISGFSNYLSVEELEAAAPKLLETAYRISEMLQYLK